MVKYLVRDRIYTDKQIFTKAKKLNPKIYGSQQAVEYLKKRGFKVMFWNARTKRWNKA